MRYPLSMPYPYEITVEVAFRDLDVLGHLNHAVYFTYMETARTKYFVELLHLKGPQELPVILAEATCSYHSAAFFGERLRVGVGVSRLGNKSFEMIYQITAEDGRQVATGKTVMVMYDYTNDETIPIPNELRARIHDYQGDWSP
ncbi:MAG: thioesterase family protein [Chloroflexota bacterium]